MGGWILLLVAAALVGLLAREIVRRRRTVQLGRDAARRIQASRDEAEGRFAELEALAQAAPGGSAERPIVVAASSVVEARAKAQPCLRCGGPVLVDEHRVDPSGGDLLRVALVRCPRCGHERRLWFVIRPTTPAPL